MTDAKRPSSDTAVEMTARGTSLDETPGRPANPGPAATNPDVVLRATNLGKSYTRYSSRAALLADRLLGQTRRGQPHWALRNVSFELRKGECLGVIGRNGAGKSTLLALLAGILQPTEGSVEVKGKVLALLELGAGMDPDATGRQNARIHLMVNGVGRDEMEAKLQEVAAFADIGAAFDEPVRTYSSGMFLRVAFAANTVLKPDVLLVDEAMAVGDVFFQQKCHGALRALRAGGTALVLVSHSGDTLIQHADRAMLIRANEPVRIDRMQDILDLYLGEIGRHAIPATRPEASPDASVARLVAVQVKDDGGVASSVFLQGSACRVLVEYEVATAARNVVPGLEIRDSTGRRIHVRTGLHDEAGVLPSVEAAAHVLVEHKFALDLDAGDYTLDVGLFEASDRVLKAREEILPGDAWLGIKPLGLFRGAGQVSVHLPSKRFPFREVSIGPAHLRGSIRIQSVDRASASAQAK